MIRRITAGHAVKMFNVARAKKIKVSVCPNTDDVQPSKMETMEKARKAPNGCLPIGPFAIQ